MTDESPTIAFVLKGYPRLSETFIAQEIAALEARGLRLLIVSLRQPTDRHRHPVNERIRAPILYLPEYLWRAPLRVLRALAVTCRWPRFGAVLRQWWADLLRDPTPNRIRRFGQALVLAAELPKSVSQLHAHFIHTPGSVARYAAALLGLPWSASAHARDIYTIPAWEKREKLADCDWLVTCTAANVAHLHELAPDAALELVYHGLDFQQFPAAPPNRPARDGRDPRDPVRILSVGRAVEKKGYDDLLNALAALPRDLYWRLVHVGGGALAARLKQQAALLGIATQIDWLGAKPQTEVLAQYRAADFFVLASREAGDGDRDGLPNVLMEAQSQGLACLTTSFSAIPELIEHERTGWLVPPGNVEKLRDGLLRLIGDPSLRDRLGGAGALHVQSKFDMHGGIDRLAAKFGLPAGAA